MATKTEKNYSRRYTSVQGGVKSGKLVALDASGTNSTFILKDTERPDPLKRRREPKAWGRYQITVNANNTLKDIERIILHEYRGPCDTDEGNLFFEQAVPFLVAKHIAYGRAIEDLNTMAWASTFTPNLVNDHPRAWFKAIEEAILAGFNDHGGRPSIPPLDSVSKALDLTIERRQRCGVLHLRAIERPPQVREREAKEYDRAYQEDRRRSDGATPRSESLVARKPWVSYGISKRTYERRVERGEIEPTPAQAKRKAKAAKAALPVLRLIS